jgi:hypothetical protein
VILQDVILQNEAIFPALRREQKLGGSWPVRTGARRNGASEL